MRRSRFVPAASLLAALPLLAACESWSWTHTTSSTGVSVPASPAPLAAPPAGPPAAMPSPASSPGGTAPEVTFRSNPQADADGIIRGFSPLTVFFNQCPPSATEGERIYFSYDWELDGGMDFGGQGGVFCRKEHIYTLPAGAAVSAVPRAAADQLSRTRVCASDRDPQTPGAQTVCETHSILVMSPPREPPPGPPARPSIDSFSASPATIDGGSSSTLSWSTTGATQCAIDNGVGNVPCNGTTSVSPAATTTYRLDVSGPGGSATRTVTVTVQYCHAINWIPPGPIGFVGCPSGAVQFCQPTPIVATDSSHSQAACQACFSFCGRVAEGWRGSQNPLELFDFIYFVDTATVFCGAPGTIGDALFFPPFGSQCIPVSRWAP